MPPKKTSKSLRKKTPPSLKSTSGAGFTFEDKVAAMLLCEMLMGVHSLGTAFGVIQKLERQAGDWEPFDDLLLDIPNANGELIHCGGSVKSNRLVNTNGCDPELCAGMWATMAKAAFTPESDFLLFISAPLSNAIGDHLSSLCSQARSLDAERLDQKIVHANARKIYESFSKVGDTTMKGLPGNVLAKLIHREFDFEATISRSETTALRLCRDALSANQQSEETAKDLWDHLCKIAEELRVSGGSLTRAGVAAKVRSKFGLQDDPNDTKEWTRIRTFSREGMEEIETALTGDIRLPRRAEDAALRAAIADFHACYVIGDSGSGKSAMIKGYATAIQPMGAEIVWIKAERINALISALPDLLNVLARCRRTVALLVIDALEGCTAPETFSAVARLISAVASVESSPWSVVLSCQTPDWARVCAALIKHLAGNAVLTQRVECGPLTQEDFALVCTASSTVAKLAQEPKLRRFLSTPKMLDILLSGQLAENRAIAGEADLVDWWWEQQVRGHNVIAAEEHVARELASRMADDLRTELPPDSVAGAEVAANELIRNRVLKRTKDGLLRFEHELLADWARVMHLRGLGQEKLLFIKAHTENPPWLRAVRLLSQHLLDRVADLDQWRNFLISSKTVVRPHDEPSAENLQIIDAWLEGIIFSLNPARFLGEVTTDLFHESGWLLRRLIRRFMLVATFPDPVIQERCANIDAKTAEAAAIRYRLPMLGVWSPLVKFLASHPEQVTDMAPVELGEIAEMWARLEDYVQLKWPDFAEVVTLNAEKELRREAAGEYRHDSGSRSLGGGNYSRKTIYLGALFAAAQLPERVGKLLSKAAGIAPWEEGDTAPGTRGVWLGEWTESGGIFGGDSYVEMPPTSWPDGPTRRTSRDFFHAWFESGAAVRVFRKSPTVACDATLGFLLDWPKRILFSKEHHGTGIDRYGFTFEADRMYPASYFKGPFLQFLRENWGAALNLVVKMTNFATDRYADWWPYDDQPTVLEFSTEDGLAAWNGNHQIYGWFRYNMNTPEVVTCALMAVEKWLEECITKGESIALPVKVLFNDSRSLAFAGLLVGLGKRHPALFLNEMRPLLFLRELYMLDMQIVREFVGDGYWPNDGEAMNKLRQEWAVLPGRRTNLMELTSEWFVTRAEFQPLLNEVALAWRNKAETLPENSEDRLPLLRWAATFDQANWRQTTLDDGRIRWLYEQPEELRDEEAAAAQMRHQALLTLPYQCNEMLEKRPNLNSEQLDAIWQQLHNWQAFEQASEELKNGDEFASSFRDHRHARASLIAVLLCLGSDWLDAEKSRREWVEEELGKLLANPPKVRSFGADDTHDDYEGFLARSVVKCWVRHPDHQGLRGTVGSFVTAYRYRTIQRLFEEGFRDRSKLGNGFRDLEGLLLSISVVRRKARIDSFKPHPELIDKWCKKWLSKFAKGRGPKWMDDWAAIEIREPFPPASIPNHLPIERKERHRRDYGLDIGVLLAAYGGLPPLNESKDEHERKHWLGICKEMLAAYLRTLPVESEGAEEEEWPYEIWKADEEILHLVAARLFQCTPDEQRSLWTPILNLPPVAHHHITRFLSDVLIETIRSEPPRVAELIPIWRAMIEHLLASPKWTGKLSHREDEVWKYLFLYGGSVSSVKDKDHAPLVAALRDLFERHVKTIGQDPYDQSSFAALVVSKAGEQLLIDALEWLNADWQKASSYFWETVVERGQFEQLLQRAWQKHFPAIRQRPEALKAFKTLTLNLASKQVSVAVEIQKQIGGQ